jgi:predicted dehydrogenase
MRFGLVGTGHWARIAHAPALAATDDVEFAAVWGRNPQAAAELAAQHQATAYPDIAEFLAAVDAVSFAAPPDVQAATAVRAAGAGRHLLLEKPIATSRAAADELVQAVADAGVASVVFFTYRFRADVRAWLHTVAQHGPWSGGSAIWLGSALQPDSPFNTPWRQEKGGLWDLGPHALSLLWPAIGPVTAVTADAGRGDLTHLVLHHEGGATSTVTLTGSAPEAADNGLELSLWGQAGRSAAPTGYGQSVASLRTALTELVTSARSGQAHPCDVRFGHDVGEVIAAAQDQLDALRRR